MKRSDSAFIPISISAVLLLAIGASWGAVAFGGMVSVYAWAILVPITVPVLGLFALAGATLYGYKFRRDYVYVAIAFWLGVAAVWPGLWRFGVYPVANPASLTFTQPEITVRLPSNEPLIVLWGGNSLDTNMYRATSDQRWAYDFGVEPVLVGSDELGDYGCYGTPVVAPTSAEVWHVVDGKPDQIPGITKTNDPFGNTVILKLGASFLVLAHLRNGSVIVEAGDKVKEGQKLGECGNSGASEEPHIHIHHQRQDPVTNAIGLAEGLPLYFTNHGAARMPRGGISNGRALGEQVQHIGE